MDQDYSFTILTEDGHITENFQELEKEIGDKPYNDKRCLVLVCLDRIPMKLNNDIIHDLANMEREIEHIGLSDNKDSYGEHKIMNLHNDNIKQKEKELE